MVEIGVFSQLTCSSLQNTVCVLMHSSVTWPVWRARSRQQHSRKLRQSCTLQKRVSTPFLWASCSIHVGFVPDFTWAVQTHIGFIEKWHHVNKLALLPHRSCRSDVSWSNCSRLWLLVVSSPPGPTTQVNWKHMQNLCLNAHIAKKFRTPSKREQTHSKRIHVEFYSWLIQVWTEQIHEKIFMARSKRLCSQVWASPLRARAVMLDGHQLTCWQSKQSDDAHLTVIHRCGPWYYY